MDARDNALGVHVELGYAYYMLGVKSFYASISSTAAQISGQCRLAALAKRARRRDTLCAVLRKRPSSGRLRVSRWEARKGESARGSVRVVPQRVTQSHPENLEVELQGPVLDVVEVVLDPLLDRRVAAPAVHLRPTGDA